MAFTVQNPTATNLYNVFIGLGNRFGDRPALTDKTRSISFAETAVLASQVARALAAEGIEPGQNVGIASHDALTGVVSMIAIWALGASAVHVDFRTRPDEKQRLAQEFDIVAMLEDRPSRDASYHSIVLGDGWQEKIKAQPGDHLPPRLDHAPAIISLTSGTTGRPTGIVVGHESLLCRYLMHIQEGFLGRGKRYLCAIPLSYSASRNHTLVRMLDGGTIHFQPPLFSSEELVEAFRRSNSNSAYIVPTILRGLMERASGKSVPLLPDMEMLFLSGAFTTPDEKLLARKLVTPEIYELYSSTIAGNMAFLHPADMEKHADSVGRVLPHARLEIVDENDRPLKRGETGIVRVCSPGMPDTIYRDQFRESGDRLRNGWAYPGDIGSVDKDGFLRILGRASEVIIRGGANVHPSEIEAVVSKVAGVREAAAVGYAKSREGEEIAVFVTTDGNVSEEDILAFCRGQLPPDKRPRKVVFVNTLPRNNSGKVVRRELAERLAIEGA